MKRYELSPEARDDLQEIWVYIASDNPSAADKLEEDEKGKRSLTPACRR